ncbi:MAG TPA: hypothetical protein PLA71_00965 [Saccharofermentans sp.]|nr:hypothetical protein [Saccharofermentans sp.]
MFENTASDLSYCVDKLYELTPDSIKKLSSYERGGLADLYQLAARFVDIYEANGVEEILEEADLDLD